MDAITNLILSSGRALARPESRLVIAAIAVALIAFVVATILLAPEPIAPGTIDVAPFRW